MNILLPRRAPVITPLDLPIAALDNNNSYIRRALGNAQAYRSTTSYFTLAPPTNSLSSYTYISTASGTNTFYTVVNVSGKGKLLFAECNTSTLASTYTIQATMDGKVYVISRTLAAGQALLLGHFWCNQNNTAPGSNGATVGTDLQSLPGTYASSANLEGTNICNRLSPEDIIAKFFDRLPPFKSSLKVEVKSSAVVGGTTGAYTCCSYVLTN